MDLDLVVIVVTVAAVAIAVATVDLVRYTGAGAFSQSWRRHPGWRFSQFQLAKSPSGMSLQELAKS